MNPGEVDGLTLPICDKCGWRHAPADPCRKKKFTEKLAQKIADVTPEAGHLADLRGNRAIARLEELGAQAKEAIERGENQPVPTGRACPQCKRPILRYRNFLGREWEGYPMPSGDFETPEDHEKWHARTNRREQTDELPELILPRRERKDIDG